MDRARAGSGEAAKLQQHLTLLKEEYVKLQRRYQELEQKYAVAAATAGDVDQNSFVARLLLTVAGLFDQTLYSDMKVKLKTREIPAHSFVLVARRQEWGSQSLPETKTLDWTDLESNVAESLLRWVYTDQVDLSGGDDHLLDLMRAAGLFHLDDLVKKCENALMASVNVKNCVRFYTTADEIGAKSLKEHCSTLISAHWDDFSSEDFSHMSAQLLYSMFKSKTQYPLHSAIRLKRDDVVFLYLVENTSKLSVLLNAVDGRGELPLDLALRDQQTSLARTLVEHGADLDAQDSRGWTLLHCAIERGDSFAANFLLEKGAAPALRTPARGDTALHMVAGLSPDTTAAGVLAELTAVAELMLRQGLDPNLQNKQGFAPLHVAVQSRNADVFSLLLKCPNIDLNVRNEHGHCALYYALLGEGHGAVDGDSLAARLVAQGAAANPVYPAIGDSLLHVMAREKLEEQALFLSKHANNVNHVNAQGQSAMHLACERGLSRLVAALLEAGGNPNLQTLAAAEAGAAHRQTPLHVAVANAHEDAARVIVDYRINYRCQKGDPRAVPTPNLDCKDSAGDTPLSLAIRLGMQEVTQHMLTAGADVNVRNGKGLTLLHQAILNEDSKMANFLLNCGADMNALTSDNETPLELCIRCRLPDVVESLCTRGVDMSIPDKDDRCPLWAALESGQEDIASILVRNGADTDCWGAGPDGCLQSLLHKAIDENQETIANFLIRSGCDLNAPRRPGPSGSGGDEAYDLQGPLHLCCSWGLQSTVKTLVEHGANVNAKDVNGHTPLHIAIQNQHPPIITLLLCHPSIDLSIRDKTGLSPFAAALTVRNHKAAQAILDKMPNAAEQTDNKGRNFLHTAIQKNDSESVLFLLSINVDVNSRVNDANQTPPLHLAAITGNDVLVRSLFLAGARPNDVDAHKRNALHVASEAGHANIVSACLSNAVAYDSVDSGGDTALHIACREGHLQVVRTLLEESQLNAEAMNLKGQNPLHVLARHGKDNSAAICELFIEFMPDYPINKPDLDGNTALMLAYMKGNGNLCRALVKAKACIGSMNKDGVTIFNYQVTTKQLLYSLLNQLSEEPPWAEGDVCLDCGTKFGFTVRKHHCRHCGRVLCSNCSGQDVPILKFNQKKPVRVCSVCFDFLQVGAS
ncbi:hypothetical protein ONE63_010710 [Megalurothrips usitatus]|uniref:Rabankyrin-5 n=1 Tax=Megalurothrips usitatus TaxID=439358 RepID=A0AAV7XDV1_9NEOP|nr:hypothetical protein ONE63_010710 [Megalurothrips usitatus]